MASLRLCSHIKTNGVKCGAACSKRDDCLSPRGCKKLPKIPGYHRVDNRLVRDTQPAEEKDSSFRAEHAPACAVEGPAFLPTEATTVSNSPVPQTSTALDAVLESSPADRGPGELVRGVRANCGEQAPSKFPPSRANARRQTDATEEKQKVLRLRDSRRSAQDDTSKTNANPYADNILGFKTNALIDLPGKFPQLAETKQPQN